MIEIPGGFNRSARTSPYLDHVGPIFERGEGDDYCIGLRVDHRHVNRRGHCHGGFLALLADIGLGRVIAPGSRPQDFVTVSLTLNYLAPAKLGQWLEVSATIDRLGGRIGHATGLVTADGEPVLRASGVFQRLIPAVGEEAESQ
ncbi:MAG TPA: PaaI family thioesterase [Stellaceae bacterium]|nr:PaaI family thioesterase [Stellaceae bacterium]